MGREIVAGEEKLGEFTRRTGQAATQFGEPRKLRVDRGQRCAGPKRARQHQAVDTLRRSKGLDAVFMVARSGEVHAAWHGGKRDSGRFTDWFSKWKTEQR